jgi:hypothetical protein
MKIDQVFETPEGKVQFKGELSGKELEAAVSVGLNYLLASGAMVQLTHTNILTPAHETNH